MSLIQQRTLPAIVSISVLDNNGEQRRGSGFFVDDAGLFVTNFQLIQDARRITLHSHEGWLHAVDDVIALSRENELALLRVRTSNTKPLSLAPPDFTVLKDAPVIAAGSPQKLRWNVIAAAVSNVSPRINSATNIIQFTAQLTDGHKGGPLMDQHGRVIGVIAANDQQLNRAIHIRHLRELMTRTNALPLSATWSTPPKPEPSKIVVPPTEEVAAAEVIEVADETSNEAATTDTAEEPATKELLANTASPDNEQTAAEQVITASTETIAEPTANEATPTAEPVTSEATTNEAPKEATIPPPPLRKAVHIGQIKRVVWHSVGGGREAAELCPSIISSLLQKELGIATVSNSKNADATINMGGRTDTGKECNMWGCFDGYRLFMNVEINNFEGKPLFRDYFEVDEDDVNEACEELAEDIIDELEDFVD